MRYYVVTDTHGFYTELMNTLDEKGFFSDKKPHKLLILGDLMDRGREAVKMQDFVCDCLRRRRLVLIRGNHEDLMKEMIEGFPRYRSYILRGWGCHHVANGTFDTALQLTGFSKNDALTDSNSFLDALKETPFVKKLIPKAINYFETDNYVFTHGWLPLINEDGVPQPDWRSAAKKDWDDARWFNGMDMAEKKKLIVPGKTVVCGHWHSSYGHSAFEGKGSEFGDDADFSPYYGNGVIGLDGCTIASGKVNCLVIEDEPVDIKRK